MVTPSPTTTRPVFSHDTQSDSIHKEPRLAHTSTNITLSPELFEKLYLSPKTPHATDHVGRYANATPLGFLGFVISTFTFSMVLMGWGGASGLQAVVGIFLFTGPLSFGMLQLPTLGPAAAYSPTGDAAAGAVSKEMNAVIALYLLVWGFALATFWLFSIRINVVFAAIFGLVTVGTWVLSGAYWALSAGYFDKALKLQKAGGALLFVVAFLGWCMLVVIRAAEMRWSVCLPIGDLSHYWASTDVELTAMANEKRE
ncbi:hypothetical protein EJ02DRAFT_445282 [Clathrospora elynae]|uniref:Plasma membrane ammonium transporter n=1 Tax=Clathrospora elynae TaxID=706981 RepID=A0A6A5SM46_9PLEO|nr:hypothetical protein EJ02DRAFT_445282 [Clathrospora elynae]